VPIYRGHGVTGIAQDDTGVDVTCPAPYAAAMLPQSDRSPRQGPHLMAAATNRTAIRLAAGVEVSAMVDPGPTEKGLEPDLVQIEHSHCSQASLISAKHPDPRSGVSVTLGSLLLPDATDGDRVKHRSAVRVQRPCTGFHLPLPRRRTRRRLVRETCLETERVFASWHRAKKGRQLGREDCARRNLKHWVFA
jgi:hypothetical protein